MYIIIDVTAVSRAQEGLADRGGGDGRRLGGPGPTGASQARGAGRLVDLARAPPAGSTVAERGRQARRATLVAAATCGGPVAGARRHFRFAGTVYGDPDDVSTQMSCGSEPELF